MRARRRFAVLLLGLALAGCHNCDLVEAELRTRENELHEARAEVERLDALNKALLQELGAVRHGAGKLTPELATQTYTVRCITLGRGTGGVDDDKMPGDEALRVVLEPRDVDGHSIKAPGSAHVEVLQVTPEGLKTPLSFWDLSPNELRCRWQTGLFCSGYVLVLPWKIWPLMPCLRVVARFKLPDGRLFEADRDITVRLPPPGLAPLLPVRPPADMPALPLPDQPDQEPTLPMPHPAEPTGQEDKGATLQPAAAWQSPEGQSLRSAVHLGRPIVIPGGL
jgi:hypothetical protein